MAYDISTARDDDRLAMWKLGKQAFAARVPPYDEDDDRSATPLDRRLVARDPNATGRDPRDRIVGQASTWELGQWFGGRRVPMAGVSGVAVAPAYRNRGVGSELIRATLAAARERGEVIATLFPMNHTFYRRHGWELAGGYPHQRVELRAVAELPRPSTAEGRARIVRAAEPSDLAALRALHDDTGRLEAGNLAYGPEFAARRLLGYEGIQEAFVVEAPDGTLAGGVTFTHADASEGREFYRLDVRSLVAADLDAELALWRVLAGHHPVARTVDLIRPQSLLLPSLLGERGAEPAGHGWAWMTRLVDAAGAVAARGYDPQVRVEVELMIRDDLLPANAGPHVLRVADGMGRLEPGGRGTVEVPVGQLASLYTGWADPAQLARLGLIRGASQAEVAGLARAFSGRTPWSADFF